MANKKNKKHKLKARLPRGFGDRSASDIRATEEMMGKIRAVYERYGFDPVETPMFEYTDALGKFLPDSDRPNEGVFSLQDDDEQWMSLRYDLTAPLARHFAENFNDIQTPYRTYRAGWVFRNEKPGPGRFRQFMQFDADIVGAPNVSADAEMCMMMADTMEALGIARGEYVIRVNNRKVLDGLLDSFGLGGIENESRRVEVLRCLDAFDRLGIKGVLERLTTGRKDESGDYTVGVGLHADIATDLVRIFTKFEDGFLQVPINGELVAVPENEFNKHLSIDSWSAVIKEWAKQTIGNVSGTPQDNPSLISLLLANSLAGGNQTAVAGVNELAGILGVVRSSGYGEDRIRIDPSVVRGLEYYTGPVYEAELLFDVTNEKGQKVQFGSVGGGGRYDGLVSRFRGEPVPATGFSIGVSRLMTALKNLGKLDTTPLVAPVIVCVMDRDIESLGRYQAMTQKLRNANIRAEMYQGNPKQFGKQLQYADRRGSGIAIIQGSDEREAGEVQIKDLFEGKRLSENITDNEAWRAERPAQFSVKEDDLVDAVRKRLELQANDKAAEKQKNDG